MNPVVRPRVTATLAAAAAAHAMRAGVRVCADVRVARTGRAAA